MSAGKPLPAAMPTVPDPEMLPPVDRLPVNVRMVAAPFAIAISARMSLMAMPEAAATKRAPDVDSEPPIAGELVVPRTCRLTFELPVSDRPDAASFDARKENGTPPEKSSDRAREPVSTVPPPLRPSPAPPAALAWKLQPAAGKVAAGGDAASHQSRQSGSAPSARPSSRSNSRPPGWQPHLSPWPFRKWCPPHRGPAQRYSRPTPARPSASH